MGLELLDKAFPLIVTLGLAVSIPLVFMGLSALLGPRRPNPAKLSPYECGIQNRSTSGDARERVDVKFYLSAVCFLVFDVEVAFLFPWAVWFSSAAAGAATGAGAYLAMAVFAGVLAFGWFYLLKRGALTWD